MMPNEVQALIAKVIFFMISFTMLCTLKARAGEFPEFMETIESNAKGKVSVVRTFE